MEGSACWVARKDAVEIGVDDCIPVVLLHAHGQAVARNGGVVHQNVDRSERFRGICGTRPDTESGLLRSISTTNASAPSPAPAQPPLQLLAQLRAASTTRTPAEARASAHACPIPRLAPVTKAVRSTMRDHHNKRRMAYTDLRDFIRALEKRKQLRRISQEIDPVLEITEFADRAVKAAVRRCSSRSRRAAACRC